MKIVKDFPDYKISEAGDVWSFKGCTPKKLKPRIDSHGYVVVNLYRDKKPFTVKVHRLVASAYIPNPNNLPCVLHLDDDKSNPNKTNLKWGTHQDNSQDMLSKNRQGGHYRGVKVITPANETLIFVSVKQASNLLNLNYSTLHNYLWEGREYYKGFKIERLPK